jgi:arginine exporter protein ArgO
VAGHDHHGFQRREALPVVAECLHCDHPPLGIGVAGVAMMFVQFTPLLPTADQTTLAAAGLL